MINIDLEQVMTYGKGAAVGGLSLTFIWAIIWPLLKNWFISFPKTETEVTKTVSTEIKTKSPIPVNSDKTSPEGFVDHVMVIIKASPYANASTQLEYVQEGLTEAQTLRREVERMGPLKSNSGASPL